jgi:dsDNA-specific endonuclease/ATPase MutS2
MVRLAVPLPARRHARVDYFETYADIGDMQSVSGDLSTFSGHLLVCSGILKRVRQRALASRNDASHTLVLLDEIGTGGSQATAYTVYVTELIRHLQGLTLLKELP